jgi:peptide/nickel transport system substrate-binding protein
MRALARRAAPGLVAMALLVAGCGRGMDGPLEEASAGRGEPAYGDTFIEASIGDIAGLIPNITSDAASHAVGGFIYDGLMRTDKDLNLVGQIAESWTFSRDCLSLTFKLRRDVKWHDGHPFTAADVKFTYEAMINPKTPTAYRDDFLLIKSLEVLDDHAVRITYAQPLARALQTWGTSMLPKHLLERYVAEGRLKEAPENSRPVGTGPYRFQEWRSGEKVVLVANPDHYDGRPYLSRIVYRIIPSQATIFLELKARGVDLASLTALQYQRQTEYPAFRKAFRKYRYPSSGYTYFGFNLADPRFADRRVRQAFAHAINKQELIDGVVLGLAREATGPYRPGSWAYTDQVHQYPYDPARARALLEAAGWKDRNGDGMVEDRDGRPFAFTIRTNQGNEERKKVAEIIQQRLKDVGVNADIQIIEWASFIKEFIKKRRFEAIVLGWAVGTDPDQYAIWHSSQRGPDQLNHIGYSSGDVDAALEAGRTTCIQSERVAHYHRIQRLLAADQPVIFLYFRDALPAVASRVRGIEPAPAGITYNFTEWFVPRELQRYTSG